MCFIILLQPVSYEFNWNEYEQGLAIGAYYWIHWLSEIPGGILARKYGTKLVFGMGNLLAALLGLLLPIAMAFNLSSLIVIRALQGLVAVSHLSLNKKFKLIKLDNY